MYVSLKTASVRTYFLNIISKRALLTLIGTRIKKNHHSHVIYCIFLFRLCIKVDRIKIENLTLILEAAPVDLDPDCRTPVSGGICDLLLYFRRVLNGIVLFFYVLIYKNFLRKYDPKCMYLQTLSLFEGYSLSPLLTITIFEYRY